MKYILILLLLIPVSFNSFSQKKKKSFKRIYVDERNNVIAKNKAAYYVDREIIEETKKYYVFTQHFYYTSGILFESSIAKYEKSRLKAPYKFGPVTRYYPNGLIKNIFNYEDGLKKGPYSQFYNNGKIEKEGRIESFNKIYLYSHYDTSGINLLEKGTGNIYEFNEDYNTFLYSEVKDSLILTTYFIEDISQDTIYLLTDVPIEPLEGWEAFYDKLKISFQASGIKKIKSRNFKITGIINEEGELANIQFLNSTKPDEEKKLIEYIKSIGFFNPPQLSNGKRVKMLIGIPFVVI